MNKIKLALELNKIVHENIKDAPHDIGLFLADKVTEIYGRLEKPCYASEAVQKGNFLTDFRDLLLKHKATLIADNFYSSELTLQIQFKEDPYKEAIHLDTYCDGKYLSKLIEDYS